jgi:uncharacterized membrane protein
MTGFELLKFLHVVSVIAWVGGAIGLFVIQARMRAAGDMPGLMSVGRQMETMGKIYYGPLSVLTLVTGILMISTTDGLSYSAPWVVIGLIAIVATLVIGLGVISPTGAKLLEESSKPEPDRAVMAGHANRIRVLSVINISILIVAVWAMVVRPGA